MHPSLTIGLGYPFPGAVGLALGGIAVACACLARTTGRFAAHGWLSAYLLGALGAAALALAATGAERATIPSFAAMLLAGVACSWLLLLTRLQRLGMSVDRVLLVLLGGLGAAVAGGRVVHVMVSGATALAGVARGYGLSVFGAIVGASLFLLAVSRARSVPPFGTLLDAGTAAVFLGLGVTRLGCLLGGCCYGRPVEGFPAWLSPPLSLFAPGTPARAAFAGQPLGLGIVAVQPLEAAALVLVAALAELAWRRRIRWRLPAGGVFALGCAGYGAARFALQFLRGDGPSGPSGFGTSHLLAIGLAVVPGAIALAARGRSRSPTG
jgi:phosphatidylglycerol:prolipoprotein diacylglycerol transferase